MINNRQGGRRRGRGGGGRAPNMNPGAGNRQDNRQRGNAAQLLEKYKGLARDTQMQGDRVQTEYYLQFADHYYRILNENRARFEEQRRQRGEGGYESSYEDEESEELEASEAPRERESGESEEMREPREGRENRESREGRESREPRDGREDQSRRDNRRDGNGEYRSRRYRSEREETSERYGEAQAAPSEERIAADILPPSIGPVGSEEGEEEARTPRRRPRRPRDDSSDEIAPAA